MKQRQNSLGQQIGNGEIPLDVGIIFNFFFPLLNQNLFGLY